MSQENVEVVRRMWGRTNAGAEVDLPAILVEFFDPEIEWHDAPSLPGSAVYRGHEALRRHIEDYLDAWADSGFEIEEIRSAGDRVLTRGRYFGVGLRSPRQSARAGLGLPEIASCAGGTSSGQWLGAHAFRSARAR